MAVPHEMGNRLILVADDVFRRSVVVFSLAPYWILSGAFVSRCVLDLVQESESGPTTKD